jgi:hypothetical protein
LSDLLFLFLLISYGGIRDRCGGNRSKPNLSISNIRVIIEKNQMIFNEKNQMIYQSIALKMKATLGHSIHIFIHFHFVRELVELGIVRIKYISTHDQIADILTKPLPVHAHEKSYVHQSLWIPNSPELGRR